ncbi:hypothetical protein B488_04750 [Liberibacter crescens BT-1]|uniref:Uncharacterized protein n=1 Tax=Liberibacter crescens (strain BT-1) TaxID=1215343 RepID=L0EU32_LIBCB|nr:hypothetical protein [Liberibacter crescens]AGA64467.1 hypothetical protein B488_04750 [Liberibacter crescens BT-1]
MRNTRIEIRIDEDLLHRVDNFHKEFNGGLSRAHVLRMLIEAGLENKQKA